MGVNIIPVKTDRPDPGLIQDAADRLSAGEVIAFPTETVYGLAACLDNDAAMQRLRALKDRPPEVPFTVQVATQDRAEALLKTVPMAAKPLMKHFWPGPLTLVFRQARYNAGGEGLGIRVPADPVALAILKAVGKPLAVPSANPKGKPPALTAAETARYFPDGVALVLDGGKTQIQEASTVASINALEEVTILRAGLISADMIQRLVCGKTYLFVCTGNTCRSPMAQMAAQAMAAQYLGLPDQQALHSLGYRFMSAGTDAHFGEGMSLPAQQALKEAGFSVHAHRAVRLTRDLVAEADTVFAVTQAAADHIMDCFPAHAGKVRRLGTADIADPHGAGLPRYREALNQIRRALSRLWGGGT